MLNNCCEINIFILKISGPLVYSNRYKFVSVERSILNTSIGLADVIGNVGLVTGYGGETSVLISAESQAVIFTTGVQKFLNPDSCSLGFTLRFSLKLTSVCDGSYILSTWGVDGDGSGPAVSVCDGQVYVRVRTMDREWTSKVGQVEINRYPLII